MSSTPTEVRYKRSWAKGSITKVSTGLRTLQATEVQCLREANITRQQDALTKGDETFRTQHYALLHVEDGGIDEAQYLSELSDHQATVEALQDGLQEVMNCFRAQQLISRLEDALEGLERAPTGVDTYHDDTELFRVNELVQKFREVRLEPGAEVQPKFKDFRDEALDRLRALQSIHHTAKTPLPPEPVPTPEVPVSTPSHKGLKIKLPTFSGAIMDWDSFWDLFSSLLDKEKGLSYSEKKCHLIAAMSTPEAQAKAQDAFDFTTSYEEAVARLKETYERKRVVHAAHLKELMQLDHFANRRSDIVRALERLERNIRGLTKVGGYSASQIVTGTYEAMMDPTLLTHWRRFTSKSTSPPSEDMLKAFLKEQQDYAPEDTSKRSPKATLTPVKNPKQNPPKTLLTNSSIGDKCPFCSQEHGVFQCNTFSQKDLRQRRESVRAAGLCFNCLRPGHKLDECRTNSRCQKCRSKHHTLLHRSSAPNSESESSDEIAMKHVSDPGVGNDAYIVPNTAIVPVHAGGLVQKVRVQLDSGAGTSVITRQLAQTLKAPRVPNSGAQLKGLIGADRSPYQVEIKLICTNGEEMAARFYVLDQIPTTESRADVSRVLTMPFLQDLPLADPTYRSGSRIDILVGIGLSTLCCLDGVRFSPLHNLKAERTVFGWVVGGNDTEANQRGEFSTSCLKVSVIPDDTEALLTRFWDLERVTDESQFTTDEQQAVDHYNKHVNRDEEGRYCVSLPRRLPTPKLGNSRRTAQKRFLSHERSLKRKGMFESFTQVLGEYGELGHAEKVPEKDLNKPDSSAFYLPMHSVVKESSTSTKHRVVFDGSAKTTSGHSLNDTLLPGPSLYPLLPTTLNRFRLHHIAITADISKMFREVGLNPEEFDMHRFLQRGEDHQLEDWRMKRVTFGVASSPFLATQTLRRLADDYQQDHPEAAAVIKNDFYVDDCITGAPDVESAGHLCKELQTVCSKGQMRLCKFRSNSKELLATISPNLRETSGLAIVTEPGGHSKTLGLHWDSQEDCFHVATPEVDLNQPVTKRIVASTIARTFDLLGWFAPAMLPAKILLRAGWKPCLGWDEPYPEELQQRWSLWVSQLNLITSFPIPRCLGLRGKTVVFRQLHGFSDASLAAYGGVVYVRTFFQDLSTSIDLISSRSRIAPIKPLTVPRLELCGALQLAQLISVVADDLSVSPDAVFGWCDSSTVLGWMNKDPGQLCTFVANRIMKISNLLSPTKWRYVATNENPADILSRGVMPAALGEQSLWWKGPDWLMMDPTQWPRRPDINRERELPELRASVMKVSVATEEMGGRVSSFERLIRITAWIKRFINNCKGKQEPHSCSTLSSTELIAAKLTLLKHSQRAFYQQELSRLQNKRILPDNHPLASLSPFLDEDGVMRVGGRLQQSNLPVETTHPIILNSRSRIVQLMVEQTHRTLLHSGTSTMMSTLSQTFHIPRMRRLVRKITSQCIPCRKANARTAHQYMGQLPEVRTRPSQPFTITGIDFAGPVYIKRGSPRRPVRVKTYLCLFICFSTKATHLEVVSDMTTPAFLAALTRFTARRGLPTDIYTDNGSNFLGAQAELKQMLGHLRSEESERSISVWTARHEIHWHFSPARAPHFGGLWEAAVRSLKSLLRRTLGEQSLTFEELTTIVTEAEAALNSRPLAPLDATPDDAVAPLTPGHFLVGRPLKALPSLTDCHSKLGSLRRWNLVQRLSHDLWKRWQREYLVHLQKRIKWKQPQLELKEGDIVLIKDCDTFQRSWPMGKVEKTYPGKDGHVRVVDVLANGKIFRRPIAKLVLLKEEETSFSGGECLGPSPKSMEEAGLPEVMTG